MPGCTYSLVLRNMCEKCNVPVAVQASPNMIFNCDVAHDITQVLFYSTTACRALAQPKPAI